METYVDRADEILVPHQNVREQQAKDDGEDPRTQETFNRLLGRDLNQLGPSEGYAADVGENVVRDDQRNGEEEPYHALEDVVHDEVGLDNNEVQRHVSPGELGELELVVPLLQRSDEEDEA